MTVLSTFRCVVLQTVPDGALEKAQKGSDEYESPPLSLWTVIVTLTITVEIQYSLAFVSKFTFRKNNTPSGFRPNEDTMASIPREFYWLLYDA